MRLRPSTDDDREAVLRLLAERDQADFGEPDFTASLLLGQWRSREFRPSEDAVVAQDTSEVVGYAAVFPYGALALVHPAREGEGIGTALLHWTEERARPRGTFRQRLASRNRSAVAFLESVGYRRARSVHYLGWDGQPELPLQPLPDDIALYAIDVVHDAATIHALDALAFSQNADYRAESLEAFCDEHLSDPNLHLASSRIAREAGQPAGFVVCRLTAGQGYIDLLAVAPDARRRGLGRALLCHALSTLAAEGADEIRLDVASDNSGALELYRSVGMRDRHEVVVYEKASR